MAGMIALLKNFARSVRNGAQADLATFDPGGGEVLRGENFAPPGDDSHPLPGDYLYAARARQSGRYVATGYIDPANAGEAAPGEKRFYSRDGSGAVKAVIWLRANGNVDVLTGDAALAVTPAGSISGTNAGGSFELTPAGDFEANGAKMTIDGDVVTSDGISLRAHVHAQQKDSGNDTQVPTDPPTPTP